MFSGYSKIVIARKIIVQECLSEIKDILLDNDRPLLKISFLKGLVVYIRFNDYQEYSYQINFSFNLNDRIRFDNFDANWPVKTQPHHLHPRGKKDGIESPMIGDPNHDIPLLIEFIRQVNH